MQEINNFCKKMQNYFVMSKKMPTFAPSKVIVHINVFYNIFFLKKQLIFI